MAKEGYELCLSRFIQILDASSTISVFTIVELYLTGYIEQLYDSRSLFRFFKSLFEYKRIQSLLQRADEIDKYTLFSFVSSRACYFMYYLFDNLYILLKVMNVPEATYKLRHNRIKYWSRFFRKVSRMWQFLGIAIFLVYSMRVLRKTYIDENTL